MTATEAASALRVLKGVRCDLVALDLEMPGVDGLALCKLLRAQPTTSKLPIIALSESDDEARKVQAFTAGADDYITKPSTPGELLSRVSLHVRTSQREWALIGSNRELRFLSDIGRGLLRALEPEQLVRRVAGATYEAIDASLCAAYVTVGHDKHAVCVFDREGGADDPIAARTRRRYRMVALGGVGKLVTDHGKEFVFCLRDDIHTSSTSRRFVLPAAQRALIVAFDLREECGETERRLIEAAAQQTSLAAHICSLYQAARDTSVSLAREVERRTAEIEAQRKTSSKRLSIVCRCRFTRSIASIEWWRGTAIANSVSSVSARLSAGQERLQRAHAPTTRRAGGRVCARVSRAVRSNASNRRRHRQKATSGTG